MDSSLKYVVVKRKVDFGSFTVEERDVGYVRVTSSKKWLILVIRLGVECHIESSNLELIDITKTGDRFKMKICDRCFKLLETDSFSNNRIKKGGVITKRPSCKECRKIKDGKPVSSEDRKIAESIKPQDGELFYCPICQKTTIAGISKHVLDHNHSTGKVRGFICESCNTGLGRFDDDVEKLEHAIKWLESGGNF